MNQKLMRYIGLFSVILAISAFVIAGAERAEIASASEDSQTGVNTNSVSEDQQDSISPTNHVSEGTQDSRTGINTNPVTEDTQDANPGGSTTPSGGNNPGESSGGRGGSRNTTSGTAVQTISEIKVSLAGFNIPTTRLARGSTYTISWRASIQNVNTSLSLVSTSGAIIPIGTSANGSASGINALNWTVPTSAILGNYTLRFIDSGNRITNAPSLYTIVSRSSGIGAEGLGTGDGNISLGSGAGTGAATETTDILPDLSENSENLGSDQGASVISAFGGFWNKYFLWFFILFLIIAVVLLVQGRRNRKI